MIAAASLCAMASDPTEFMMTLPSPVFEGDSILFQVKAPHAGEVAVSGQFLKSRIKLTKGPDGIWKVKVKAPEPNIYPYQFEIDGTQIADPGNPLYFISEIFKPSLLEVKSPSTLTAIRNVPHGKVHYCTYHSETLGEFRNVVVYTPAEYDECTDVHYPVLYLISGTTDTEEGWYKVGRANTIADNLIADGAASPAIIVMPYGYVNMGNPRPSSSGAVEMYKKFDSELTKEVMAYIESNFRTVRERDYRAIAGFSRGGGQAMFSGFSNPDKFGWIDIYSAYLTPEVMDEYFPDLKNEANRLNDLWMCVGNDDFLRKDVLANHKYFDSHGITHTLEQRPGNHTSMHYRYCLEQSLRKLFRNGKCDPLTIEEIPSLGYTLYRPADIKKSLEKFGKLIPVVFGNGGCTQYSSDYLPLFTRLIKNGYIVLAVGVKDLWNESRQNGEPIQFDKIGYEDNLTEGIDWLQKTVADKSSPLYGALDIDKIAVGGHSCGGAQALAVSGDPRVKTTFMMNSGMGDMKMAGADKTSLSKLHAPIIYLIGGEEDIAFINAESDFKRIESVPVVSLNLPVGHQGTYKLPAGGLMGDATVKWLDWVLKKDTRQGKFFTDTDFRSSLMPEASFKSKNLDRISNL